MPPSTKAAAAVVAAATAKFLVGQPSSVLESSWHDALTSGTLALSPSLLPFNGKPRLPTRQQTLLLYFAYREVKEFKLRSRSEIAEMVANQIPSL